MPFLSHRALCHACALQRNAVQCSELYCTVVWFSAVYCIVVQCSVLYCSAVQCSVLYFSAVQCSIPLSILLMTRSK